MTELFFAFTVIFVAYCLYEVFRSVSGSARQQPTSPAVPTDASTPASEALQPMPADGMKPASQAASSSAEADRNDEGRGTVLRNPATGETAPVPNNYRFAKRWIKEAMVAEGLLDRVYRNSELEGVVSRKVKDALEQFKSIEKYYA
jgi:hypothetical protein